MKGGNSVFSEEQVGPDTHSIASMGGEEIFLHLCRLSPRHRLAAEAKVFLEG